MSLINNGITTVLDHCHIINSPEHADAAIRGLKDSGIRCTYCHGFFPNPPLSGTEIPGVDLANFDQTKREIDAQRVKEQHFNGNDPSKELVTFGIAPDEPESIPIGDTIKQIATARKLGARLITMHVAMGPSNPNRREIVRQLDEAGCLSPDLVFSHGASLTEKEMEAIKLSGAGIVGTPDTEPQMGMGFPVVFPASKRGCRTCLGLDITSNQGNDFIAQMRLALQVERAREHEKGFPIHVSPKTEEVLRMGTMGGAEVMRLENLIGSVTPGKKADLVIFRCDDIETVPRSDPVGTIVFHTSTKDIETVIINGKVVKKDGRLVGVDWPTLKATVIHRSDKIKGMFANMQDEVSRLREKWFQTLNGA